MKPDSQRIFVSYSRRGNGRKWKASLLSALHAFQKHHLVDVWEDGKLRIGSFWKDEIQEAMASSRIAILLLTEEALESEYILKVEFPFLRDRQKHNEILVIPIICEPCEWRVHDWLDSTQSPNETNALSKCLSEEQQSILRGVADQVAQGLSRLVLNELSAVRHPVVDCQVFLDKLPNAQLSIFCESRLIGREQELAMLDLAMAQTQTSIVSLVAWGGVGKTALVRAWLDRLEEEKWCGLRRVYAWSFYSQGTDQDRQVSEEDFFRHAFDWFGLKKTESESHLDKGSLLAEAIVAQGCLLILDGIEPLQYPPGPLAGRLRATNLQSLLKRLARRPANPEFPHLCVITTRQPLTDLDPYRRTLGFQTGTAISLELENLPEDAGAELLYKSGAQRLGRHTIAAGEASGNPELRSASREVDGHSLTLSLLGRFLYFAHQKDILRRDVVRFVSADRQNQGGTTFKMLAAFERWFNRGNLIYKQQLAILKMLGLFDRPADSESLNELRKRPSIDGITEPLMRPAVPPSVKEHADDDTDDEDWNTAIAFLLEAGLIQHSDGAFVARGTIHCHPLIREYFAEKLRMNQPVSWKVAQTRLFNYLKSKAPETSTPTLEQLEPLYQAVWHGSQAKMHAQAYSEVYRPYIRRENEFYSTRVLGAAASDLALIANFFTKPWSLLQPVFDKEKQASLFNQAGFFLRNQIRFEESTEPLKAARNLCLRALPPDWHNAAQDTINLSEVYLWLGKLRLAETHARQAVQFSQKPSARAKQPDRQWDALSLLGGLRYQQSSHDRSRKIQGLFRRAEKLKADAGAQTKLLISIPGFRYCELLLSDVEYAAWRKVLSLRFSRVSHLKTLQTVNERVKVTFKNPGDRGYSLLTNALDRLTLLRLELWKGILTDQPCSTSVLQETLIVFKKAETAFHLVSCLLSTSWGRFQNGDIAGAVNDLDDAWDLAERGPMRLHLADICLYRARLFFREKEYPWRSPKRDIAFAEKLIARCGYLRRERELFDAKTVILGPTASKSKR